MNQRMEEISIVNPKGTLLESQFLPSSPDTPIDSHLYDPRHAGEEGQSPPLHDLLRNLDMKEPEMECKSQTRSSREKDGAKRKENRESDGELEEYNETKLSVYPLRPGAEDCAYYMRTGNCKYGWSCKFNHPLPRINQVIKDTFKGKVDSLEKSNLTECKFYLRTGGCMYGDTCRFVHSMARTPVPPDGDTRNFVHSMARTPVPPVPELNYLGLPIRTGEKECPYYMRNGSCKFGANCKFNHPDPTTGDDPPPAYANGVSGGSISSETNVLSWSASRSLTETPYMPVMFSRSRNFSPEWNSHQAPVYAQEHTMHPRAAYLMNHSTTAEANVFAQHHPRSMDDEFPERPDQAECSYFMKTGDCKFKSNCKFHHPKNLTLKPLPCILSDKGLPLRPDQNICAHYSRYGICKFGPACKFDHPIHHPSSTSSDPDQPFNNSPATEYASNNGS